MNRSVLRPPSPFQREILPLWLLTFLTVTFLTAFLLKRLVGPVPFWVPTIITFGAGGSLGVALTQRMKADRQTFLYFVRVQGTGAALTFGVAGALKAMGVF